LYNIGKEGYNMAGLNKTEKDQFQRLVRLFHGLIEAEARNKKTDYNATLKAIKAEVKGVK
jgi:hypothetical protein